ncbi:hypothetical protein PIB30_028606 [Stylosanthes scabra]|uniref:3'-5' exonuclease domain-containing protein n=1 Tax=Stylosanthes scabra TaxID=79078 RepID=A0ABU6X966_9FABA|nr:hypothetical protein [Stylosanthes scabra]
MGDPNHNDAATQVSGPQRAIISVFDHTLPHDDHNLYDVTFHTHTIHTLLTTSSSLVHTWLSDTLNHHSSSTTTTVLVGLDIEWRPNTHRNSNNPVATLQLCIGNRCLIFQILHCDSVPQSLVDFLVNEGNTFLGVGIEEDVEKLLEDYNLNVKKFVDLRGLAESVLGETELKRAGLKTLAERVLGLEIDKPKRVSRSRWDNPWLTAEQVQYACVDAFVSFEVGRILYGTRNGNGNGI